MSIPATVLDVHPGQPLDVNLPPSAAYPHSRVEPSYDLVHGISRQILRKVKPEFIFPYKIYEEGTIGSCNVGKKDKIFMVPCTVVSAIEDPNKKAKGEDAVVYQVSVQIANSGKENMMFLPKLKVMRRIVKEEHECLHS